MLADEAGDDATSKDTAAEYFLKQLLGLAGANSLLPRLADASAEPATPASPGSCKNSSAEESAFTKILGRLNASGFVDTAVFDNAREGAKHLREDESNPYRQVMFDLDELAKKNLENPISPDQVAEVILHAATARRPKERYYTPFSAGLQAWFMHLLPARMKDGVLKRVYGINA